MNDVGVKPFARSLCEAKEPSADLEPPRLRRCYSFFYFTNDVSTCEFIHYYSCRHSNKAVVSNRQSMANSASLVRRSMSTCY